MKVHALQSAARVRKQVTEMTLNDRDKMVIACRLLASKEHCASLAGQITCRNREQSTVIAPPMQLTLGELYPGDLIDVDYEFRPVDTREKPNPATLFHLWIYKSRPDVNCIIHTHPPHACALSMLNVPLNVAHMDMCMFYDDCAHLKTWPGVPVADEEGLIISEALQGKRSILLTNHGPLVAGASIEEATYLAVMLEDAARLQLLAMSAGNIQSIDPLEAQKAHDFLLQKSIIDMTFAAYAREVLRIYPDALDNPE